MELLPQFRVHRKSVAPKLPTKYSASVGYHNRFDYPLTKAELVRWQVGKAFPKNKYGVDTNLLGEYYLVKGRNLVALREKRTRASRKKFLLAEKLTEKLQVFPGIKFVGITGSLAMYNADTRSDIDLVVITSTNTLWLTRALVLVTLKVLRVNLRKPRDKNEKDKFCFNLWLDESDLVWRKRNEYTAHEIAQIVPLVNKDQTFERLLTKNSWLLDYWPNSIKLTPGKTRLIASSIFLKLVNYFFFKVQYWYMQSKMTNEVVSLTRAQFHPQVLS